jgi:hypothetical protein
LFEEKVLSTVDYSAFCSFFLVFLSFYVENREFHLFSSSIDLTQYFFVGAANAGARKGAKKLTRQNSELEMRAIQMTFLNWCIFGDFFGC